MKVNISETPHMSFNSLVEIEYKNFSYLFQLSNDGNYELVHQLCLETEKINSDVTMMDIPDKIASKIEEISLT